MAKSADRSIELLWGDRARPSRGPKPALTVEQITAAGIGVADAEGLAAVSMQRVAGEFGFTTMSLYRYVPGKAELVALMLDTALGEPPVLTAITGGWRPRLTEWAERLWTVTEKHPWSLEASVGLRPIGPNELGWTDSAVGTLTATGLTGSEILDTVVVVTGHVRSIAQQTLTIPAAQRGLTEHQWAATVTDLLRTHGDRFPSLLAAMASATAAGQDKGLAFGLERILDGLGLLIADRVRQAAIRR
ncbi:TetR/AcrR family transcriptional regulator [Fodinicola feengrottensis]|uniref:TetR/AcrR family transcriptional regulator n=1 Tax=Fodinicola feengrottensis TaxID=435914 RepID=A0ABP4TUE1_9ACTN|nr:TetR/AcrR family transcriptional regulator C-terminal domain-containing protein [Fodinicola feengrottensis]